MTIAGLGALAQEFGDVIHPIARAGSFGRRWELALWMGLAGILGMNGISQKAKVESKREFRGACSRGRGESALSAQRPA